MRKAMVLTASMALSVVMGMTVWAANGYVQENGGWKYYSTDGTVEDVPNTGWVQNQNGWRFIEQGDPKSTTTSVIDGKLYCFDDNGYMRTGWVQGDYGSENPITGEYKPFYAGTKETYYFLPDGSGATGWQQIDGKWYYFGPDSIMLRNNRTEEGYYVGDTGEWTEAGQKEADDSKAATERLAAEDALPLEEKLQKVIDFTNEEREKRGLAPLERNESLMEAAAIRAEEIEENFDHTRPDGKRFDSVLNEVGITNGYCGENIAGHGGNAAAVVRGWMNSSGHKRNILNSKYKEIGVGYTEEGGWVQIFIGN